MRLPVLLLLCIITTPIYAQREFGFDNRKSSGQAYLSPDETVARMKVPDGFEVKLFAAEPMVVNPIAFTIDEKGRIWVVESFEYPSRTPNGKMPRDRIVILEDTDGDGQADKRTVWAEGKDFPVRFDLASGIEVGHGGVFLGAPPYLFFLQDTNGDGRCDKFEIRLKGFGSQDTHEMLNTFQWGPDGRLFGLHGIFTNSEVEGVKMNAAAWRYDAHTKKFDIFAEGTSNPWGMDFNHKGDPILACCVIPHLFHLTHGGTYKRQAGASFNSHSYGLMNEISDHTFHRESGWAHAGLISLDTPLMPEEYRHDVIFGSIHGCSLKRNRLAVNGSTYTATKQPDFLVSGDKNVRPINLRWGPNGDIYLSDWHDVYPCHQTPADAWDYSRGRIYRIQRKGAKTAKAPDLSQSDDLIAMLDDPNPYRSRYASRLLVEKMRAAESPNVAALKERLERYDVSAMQIAAQIPKGLSSLGETWLAQGLTQTTPANSRRWLIALMINAGLVNDDRYVQLAKLAATEPSPEVRAALVSLCRQLPTVKQSVPILHALMQRKVDLADPVIPLLTWLAYEPHLIGSLDTELNWLAQHAASNPFVAEHILARSVRRIATTGDDKALSTVLRFIGDLPDEALRRRALEGMVAALGNRQMNAPTGWKELRTKLVDDSDRGTAELIGRLAIVFREGEAMRRALATALDAKATAPVRIAAIKDVALGRAGEAFAPLLKLVSQGDALLEVRIEAVRALASYPQAQLVTTWLREWKTYPPTLRGEMVTVLSGRRDGAKALIDAMEQKTVARTEVTDSAITRIRTFKDKTLDARIEKVWGKFRETPEALNKLIDQMRTQLDAGSASYARGKKVFETNCGKCHQFDGQGHEVGPKLDGAERSIEYLLANILDPNRVIGAPYFVRTVELKSGRVESGLLVEDNDQAITIKGENAALKVIPKSEVEEILVVEKSVMPEGLAYNMTPQDFRDLIRYVMAHPYVNEFTVQNGTTKSTPAVSATGRFAIPEGRTQLTTMIDSPDARTTRLLATLPGKFVVRINGQEVARGQSAEPIGMDVSLKAGENRIEIDLDNPAGTASVRLLDAERRLRWKD